MYFIFKKLFNPFSESKTTVICRGGKINTMDKIYGLIDEIYQGKQLLLHIRS